jgi:hypothetical protein
MATMQRLFDSLRGRWTPEQVLVAILDCESTTGADRRVLLRLTGLTEPHLRAYRTSMPTVFAATQGYDRKLATVCRLFGLPASVAPPGLTADDDAGALAFVADLRSRYLGIGAQARDFKRDRPDSGTRHRGPRLYRGHRAFNKRFRALRRLEDLIHRRRDAGERRYLARVAKSGLSDLLDQRLFFSLDSGTAYFLAYLVARQNRRSVFTFGPQDRAYDEVADYLFKRLDGNACWRAIAWVYPRPEVLAKMTTAEVATAMGTWYNVMVRAARVLRLLADRGGLDLERLVVRRGNDSSSWNDAAGAFNRARESWLNCVYALGAEDLLENFLPGKALRLMAADVVRGHEVLGSGGLEPDTAVWAELPRPWEVMAGTSHCTRASVEAACRRHGIEGKAWVAPRPKTVVAFRPTPETVQGVVVASPALAALLRNLGYFAGPSRPPPRASVGTTLAVLMDGVTPVVGSPGGPLGRE